jgi:hypothetical protein
MGDPLMTTSRRFIFSRSVGQLAACVALAACTPDIPDEAPPAIVEMSFDPSGEPALAYEPTALVINPTTGLIDFSLAGVDVPGVPEDTAMPVDPAACQEQTELSVAQCELYQYLERLDGFPTLTTAKTPVAGALDTASIEVPDDLFVFDAVHGETLTELDVTLDEEHGALAFEPATGWDIGATYVVGVRGYADGITGADGEQVVSSLIYSLLKLERSLTCDATTAESVDVRCEFYALFATDPRFAALPPAERQEAIGATLLDLEQLRLLYRGELPDVPLDAWTTLEEAAAMPRDEVAILWTFPTHTSSVFELDPTKGLVPHVTGPSELRVGFKGSVDAATLSAFGAANPGGTVVLINATQVATDLAAGLPEFDVAVDGQELVLTTLAPLAVGDQYILVLSNEIHDDEGEPTVPSPITVLLRTRGALVDDDQHSLVDGVPDADAVELEAGRTELSEFLDDPLVKALSTTEARPDGITRELIAYLFAFQVEVQP